MELKKSVHHQQSRPLRTIANLSEDDWWLHSILCERGPLFSLGQSVVISGEVWETIPNRLIFAALDLHWCGETGAITDVDHRRNLRAIDTGGEIVSYWTPGGLNPFWIITNTFKHQTKVLFGVDA